MSSRTFQFFAMPTEHSDWLSELSDSLRLRFFVERRDEACFDEVTLEEAVAMVWWRFYITDQELPTRLAHTDLNPNRWGLVTCDRPRIDDGDLIMGTLSAKSDWLDSQSSLCESPQGLNLHGKLRREFRKHLVDAVWIRTIGTTEAQKVPQVRFSLGAQNWSRGSGRLRQFGAPLTEFITGEHEVG